ncbi:DUF4174 domain-containing protein [Mesobaculum littorinae]|uniref:DUF4174 domain-containing protein n=1 Tax=Mesobaculum littorinae TaxID=2486419 RepID=A0A438AL54_9RHOB|nr:DUF4174 domain-containing protein [Mesobaculum littorinae]RVV99400.1 DUF4174 domain-containing protein [Mesobaculum littorinae]
MRKMLSLTLSLAFAMPLGAEVLVTSSSDAAADPDAMARWQAEPAQIFDAGEVEIEDFLWRARPLVVFADTPVDPAFEEQVSLIEDAFGELVRRDVVVVIDSDPDARTDLRQDLRPRGFALVLLGKDGGVKLRKPFPWHVREIGRSIDKMPERQREMRDGNRPGG